MEKIVLDDGLSLSRLIYGMWRLADDENISAAHVQAKIEACLAQGISTIDQADIYGGYKAEEIFGAALKQAPHLRDKIEIVTKCGIVAPVGRHQKAKVKYYDTEIKAICEAIDAVKESIPKFPKWVNEVNEVPDFSWIGALRSKANLGGSVATAASSDEPSGPRGRQ